MPELPEVETTVRDLNKTVLGRKIEDVWSDTPKITRVLNKNGKKGGSLEFKKGLKGKKIIKIERK